MQKSIHSLSKEYEAVGQGKNYAGNLTETPVIPANTAEVTNSSIADVQANVQKIRLIFICRNGEAQRPT